MLGSVFENDGKKDVSGSLFWFENKIADVVLSNRFQKRNETKQKFHAKTFVGNIVTTLTAKTKTKK